MIAGKSFGIGSVVKATMGRDKNKYFLIVGSTEENYVLLADGRSRLLSKPKKKKLKHILIMHGVALDIKNKILEGRCVLDSDIRKALKSMGYVTK